MPPSVTYSKTMAAACSPAWSLAAGSLGTWTSAGADSGTVLTATGETRARASRHGASAWPALALPPAASSSATWPTCSDPTSRAADLPSAAQLSPSGAWFASRCTLPASMAVLKASWSGVPTASTAASATAAPEPVLSETTRGTMVVVKRQRRAGTGLLAASLVARRVTVYRVSSARGWFGVQVKTVLAGPEAASELGTGGRTVSAD